ncbi:hypothetical protein [Streptomyces cyaneofuscatus]|uniref:hypothetical protein n=1 Tax=Streptomyces cyaneofuscatus TaxID=66883 RepID=UPI0038120572
MIMLVLELLIVAGLCGLFLLGRGVLRQVEALREEVALARIEGVLLDRDGPVP